MSSYDVKELETLVDINGKVPKIGDFIRISRFDGIDNVVSQIRECSRVGYSPAIIKYVEFEIFDGVLNEDDIPMEESYKLY